MINAIDHYSKYAWAFLVENINSKNAEDCLKKIYLDCDQEIENIHTDNGPEFKGFFQRFLDEKNIPHRKGAPRKPTSQGCIERFNRTIKENLFNQYQEAKKRMRILY